MIALLAILLLGQSAGTIDQSQPMNNAVRLIDNGFCIGEGWVTLRDGESVTVDQGPDFSVYRVRGPGGAEWGVYSGFAGQSGADRAHVLLTKDGVAVYRGIDRDGRFDGYFIGGANAQNHIFGSMLKDASGDAAFFDRVRLGDYAKRRCTEYWKQ